MVLPHSSLHNATNNHHNNCSIGKLAVLSLLVFGVSLVHIWLWASISSNSTQLSSSLQVHEHYDNTNKQKRMSNKLQDVPLPRNGGILRSEKKRHILNHDRQQDVHRYTVTLEKPRVFILSSSSSQTTTITKRRTVTPMSADI
jgi:hypothetical protein